MLRKAVFASSITRCVSYIIPRDTDAALNMHLGPQTVCPTHHSLPFSNVSLSAKGKTYFKEAEENSGISLHDYSEHDALLLPCLGELGYVLPPINCIGAI